MREFVLRNPHDLAGCLGHITALDLARPWRVEVKRYVKRRSNQQNRAYWLRLNQLVDEIGDYTGYDANVMHRFFKAKFCPLQAVEIKGEWVEDRSTRELTTVQMAKYFDDVARWASETLGFVLDDPIPAHVKEAGDEA